MLGNSQVVLQIRERTRFAMTMVSTIAGVDGLPRTNCSPRGGCPVAES